MGRYSIEISKEALADLSKIKKSGKKSDIFRIEKIFLELETYQAIGIERLMYEIIDHEVVVILISALGCYNDK